MTSLPTARYALRFAGWTLRQRRYAKLAVLMGVLALLCVAAGTWQVARYRQNVRDNRALRANAHAAAVPLTTAMVPLTGHGTAPGRDAIRYCTVIVRGRYLPGHQQFVTGQVLGDRGGFWVLDPFRTGAGVVLVVRGFVAATPSGAVPQHVSAPPAGPVRLVGRLQTVSGAGERAHGDRIAAINPVSQAARLGESVFQASLSADAGQPGTSGLRAVPAPDLSNPAGGAVAPQHLAYVVQWYVFALLALAAPFGIARREVREAQERYLGVEVGAEQFDAGEDSAPAPSPTGSALAVRARGELARPGQLSEERWSRGIALADRYGRSFGLDDRRSLRAAPRRPSTIVRSSIDSAADVHRSVDGYHAEYNDYLWQLALADGDLPELALPAVELPPPGSVVDADPSSGELPER